MTKDRYITITAAFDPSHAFGRSLARIAPELRDSLTMIEDHTDEHSPTRTWAGVVDGPMFKRFAAAWRLPDQARKPSPARQAYTLDGMNWETDGESPIVYVTVQVAPRDAAPSGLSRTGRAPAHGRVRTARGKPARMASRP